MHRYPPFTHYLVQQLFESKLRPKLPRSYAERIPPVTCKSVGYSSLQRTTPKYAALKVTGAAVRPSWAAKAPAAEIRGQPGAHEKCIGLGPGGAETPCGTAETGQAVHHLMNSTVKPTIATALGPIKVPRAPSSSTDRVAQQLSCIVRVPTLECRKLRHRRSLTIERDGDSKSRANF
jgi:hypothetical protein